MTAQDIEILVAEYFGVRQNIIVPNVAWGMNLAHEADMIVLRPSGWAIEVEIKVTASDIKADTEKRWDKSSSYLWKPHWCKMVKLLYFALPDKLKDHSAIPEHAGILAVHDVTTQLDYNGHVMPVAPCVDLYRAPSVNKDARKFTDDERKKLAELGCMRIWKLKRHLANMKIHNLEYRI